jgi:hypothetical protein
VIKEVRCSLLKAPSSLEAVVNLSEVALDELVWVSENVGEVDFCVVYAFAFSS